MTFRRPARCHFEPPQCAEVDGLNTHTVSIRSSLRPDTVVHFNRAEWAALIEAVKAGEYELEPVPETVTAG